MFIVLIVVLVLGFITKAKWGINFASFFSPVKCPKCDAVLPMVRNPQNSTQAKWGGWTCPKCGIQIDKWGREIKTS